MELHPLLSRQLRRVGVCDASTAPDAERWGELLRRVARAYEEHDQERYLLERSQKLASEEMAALYATVRDDRDLLELRVRERTEALRVSEARLTSLLSLSADWIWEQDADLRFTYISPSVEDAIGIAPDVFIGHRRMSNENFEASADAHAAYEACIAGRRAFRDFTYRLKRSDCECRFIRISGEPVFDEAGRFLGYRGVGRDVTAGALAEQRMQDLARNDSLTGLPSRNTFLAELDRAIARARRNDSTFDVYFIDLDRFKTVNDTLGHGAGDELLVVMASRLRASLRESDLVARLGGDEFVVLTESDAHDIDCGLVADKLLAAIAAPVTLQGCDFLITGSIGIAHFPRDGLDAPTLVKHADAAMYLAKERGKNTWQVYTCELAEQAARQFSLESELRLALAREEFVLHYQPKIELATGRLRGVEALVRWMHPKRGLVAPGEFVPFAEERGLIVAIGRQVVHAACRQIRVWRAAGLKPPPVAVNLSARQFASDTLASDLVDAMKRFGVEPSELEVEITESALMAESERASEVLRLLSSMGVRIAIDDFGTGYSSLSYLKRFPADTVKIDRSFVRGLPDDANDTAITQAIIAMAHSLGLGVVAEGVETELQRSLLTELGCDEAQGYLLGHPMPANALARDWLRARAVEPLAL